MLVMPEVRGEESKTVFINLIIQSINRFPKEK